jgi:hypothetical protein
MFKPKIAIMFIIILTSLSLIVMGVTHPPQKATAQESVMTEKQKEHSKLYGQYYKKSANKKLSDITTRKANRDVKEDVNIIIGPPTPVLSPTGNSNAPALENLICPADAVVIGTVKSKASHLTADGYFVFTDYEITVEDVLKDNAAARILLSSDITVTRPGGRVYVDGRNISALDKSFLPLEEGGRYLLFLRFIPQTGAYQAISNEGSFQLRGQQIVSLTEKQSSNKPTDEGNVPSFINNIRAVAAGGCSDMKKEGAND